MRLEAFLETATFALSEGSIYERLRRHPAVAFDASLAHATLIYDLKAARLLEQVHREYLDIGQAHGVAMFALTDTWRANQERIAQSRFSSSRVNQNNARFLVELRESYGPSAQPIFIGGNIGPRGDAYRPKEALTQAAAERFHTPQLEALAEGRVDFLYASTLPAFSEARGIALAMARIELPYFLSFVVRRNGQLMDGTPLEQVIETIDASTPTPPSGYAVNCVHPSVFEAALTELANRKPALVKRIRSYQANTSAKRPEDLDGLKDLDTEEPETLAAMMLRAHQEFGTPFLGGCCGTDASHIQCLARQYKAASG